MFHGQVTRLKFKSLLFCNFPMSAGPNCTLECYWFLDYLLYAKFRISLENLLRFGIELLFNGTRKSLLNCTEFDVSTLLLYIHVCLLVFMGQGNRWEILHAWLMGAFWFWPYESVLESKVPKKQNCSKPIEFLRHRWGGDYFCYSVGLGTDVVPLSNLNIFFFN